MFLLPNTANGKASRRGVHKPTQRRWAVNGGDSIGRVEAADAAAVMFEADARKLIAVRRR